MPRLLVFYHFFHPDPVVSARIFADFAREQQKRGWDVTVVTSDRIWDEPERRLPASEDWDGIDVVRVHRPAWDQANRFQRLGNSAWMISRWSAVARTLGHFDVAVMGSDPTFAATLAVPLRRLLPRTRIVHWCFDVYPEQIEAEGGGRAVRALVPVAKAMMGRAYAACDAIVDIGSCMRARLVKYPTRARRETLVPWALVEPDVLPAVDEVERKRLFPRGKLGLLYAGSMGRPHDWEILLRLARACRARSGDDVSFSFTTRGNRFAELRDALDPSDTNVGLAPFADEADLETRLGAADMHLISLRADWSGLVVPSKFFGSLATGRPVLYAGPADSSIARWIEEHDVGIVVSLHTIEAAVDRLHALRDATPEARHALHTRAQRTYHERFSRRAINDRWDTFLRDLIRDR